MQTKFEYAGFRFVATTTPQGTMVRAEPEQHPAAYKEKHRMNALEFFESGAYLIEDEEEI